MSVTVPASTCGRSASCWSLLKRWISSMNRTVRVPFSARRSWAVAMAPRTSATPLITAESVMNSAPIASARIRASVVLPVPGGPHSSSDVSLPRDTERRSGPASPTRCPWPWNSSKLRGRIRAGSGCRSGGGWKSASGRAPVTRRLGIAASLRAAGRLPGDADELLVDELVGGEEAQLARGPAALDAAERQLGAVGEDAVDVDHAGLDAVRHARRLLRIVAVDVRAEPEAGVVRQLHGGGLVGDAVDDTDRAEELLAVGVHLGRDVGQDGR